MRDMGQSNPSQEGYYNSINPLVEGVPHIFTGLHLRGPHTHRPQILGASGMSHTSFSVVQIIGIQNSVYTKRVGPYYNYSTNKLWFKER